MGEGLSQDNEENLCFPMICDGYEPPIHPIIFKVVYIDRSSKELSCDIYTL